MLAFQKILQPKYLLLAVLAAYFFFGFQHLSQFITADEHYWVYERIPQYWDAIEQGKWKKTFINDKPGISLALVSGMALIIHHQPETLCLENQDHVTLCNTERAEKLLFAFRLPILILNGLLLLFLFWVIGKLTDPWMALFAVTLTALSPILLGISQIINPDSLLWSLSAAALFAFLALLKLRLRWYLLLAGLFLAFAVLSKYTASFLVPFFFAAAILHLFFLPPGMTRQSLAKTARENMFFFLGTVFSALAISALFFPAAWAKPLHLLNLFAGGSAVAFPFPLLIFPALFLLDIFCFRSRFIHRLRLSLARIHFLSLCRKALPFVLLAFLLTLVLGRVLFPEWALFEKIPFDLKDLYSNDKPDAAYLPDPLQSFLLELNPLAFSLTPILLVFFSLLLIEQCLPKTKTAGNAPGQDQDFVIFSLLFFFFSFLVTIIFSEVLATPRYLVMLYPVAAFLAAVGIAKASDFCMALFGYSDVKNMLRVMIFFLIFSFSLGTLYLSAPFYFNYTNSLLPKDKLIHHAWGYGGYEAAQYLNTLPDAEHLTVWADYYGVCEFFVGRCIELEYQWAALVPVDYVVVSARGETLYQPDHTRWRKEKNFNATQAYKTDNPLWELLIDGRPGNFVRVVKADNDLRAALITDIDHCPSREAVSEQNLRSFILSSQEREADLIVSLGDNASHRLRKCSKTGDLDARYIADTLRSSGLPTHLVLGDHDITSSVASYQAWLETAGRKKTYYSFNAKGVHIIILDTVLGGEPMRSSCTESPECAALEARLADVKTIAFPEYQERYADALPSRKDETGFLGQALEQEKEEIALTRTFGSRDRGRVSEEELAWLRQDIANTPFKRVIVFSDHPLFPFVSDQKRYDISNGEAVRSILEQSGKDIVALSGEAHLWHEETLNGVQYYIIDEFRKADGSWAYFSWDQDGFRLEKITH